MSEDRYDNVEELIPKYLAGEVSAEQEQRMLAWIDERPENERHYQGIKKIFELSQQHYVRESHQQLNIDVDREWAHFVSQIHEREKTILLQPSGGNASYRWLRIAAALLLLLASGLVVNYLISRNASVVFQTAENTRTVALPDGSHVTLNAHSTLSYAATFGRADRVVILAGEAFFEVAHDVQKPFTIQVNDTQVEVLGTSFNVQGYADRKEIEVVVQTGVVNFSVPNQHQRINLTPGQKGIYSKETQRLTFASNKDVNFLSWNSRRIVFTGDDLRTVIETLNRTYQANITLASDIPASCVVTVTFDHQTLEAVLRVLETTLNLSYRITSTGIEITSAGC